MDLIIAALAIGGFCLLLALGEMIYNAVEYFYKKEENHGIYS